MLKELHKLRIVPLFANQSARPDPTGHPTPPGGGKPPAPATRPPRLPLYGGDNGVTRRLGRPVGSVTCLDIGSGTVGRLRGKLENKAPGPGGRGAIR